ncbi:STAS/SEC14 domain-containing protein [Rufibacter sp. LB8]|uniref:STAS/SEC14 domain-containing protein n=1 Tax=Rufibacter sp. LB8 TaxID=2777781 RepID=UPI00178C3F2A|nr:STAS/SEC14 domain-containing protein [Rufibacter sp. LB8]
MTITYFQNHGVTITYDEQQQLGIAEWNGFLNGQEFREAITACLQLMEEHKPLRWLGDNRKMKAMRQADQEWFVTEIMPKLHASSLLRNAVVVSEDFFNRAAVEQMYKRAAGLGDLVTREFQTRLDALQWLSEAALPRAQEQQQG